MSMTLRATDIKGNQNLMGLYFCMEFKQTDERKEGRMDKLICEMMVFRTENLEVISVTQGILGLSES